MKKILKIWTFYFKISTYHGGKKSQQSLFFIIMFPNVGNGLLPIFYVYFIAISHFKQKRSLVNKCMGYEACYLILQFL